MTEIRDPFNNRIEFEYFDASGPPDGVRLIRQHLSATQVREVTFTHDNTGLNALSTMTYNGRTWQYFHAGAGPPGHSTLFQVQPPAGRVWTYAYGSGLPGELTKVTTPGGGTTTYVYAAAARRAGPLTMTTRVVESSTAGGPDVPAGTWTFSYGQGSNQDWTYVACPCGTTRYRFNGTGVSGSFDGWSAGTLAEVLIEEGGALLQKQTFTYAPSDPISSDDVSGEGGVWADTDVRRALVTSQEIRRGPHIWTTTFDYHYGQSNYNDHGRAWRITESGDQARTITRTFQYGFTPYIVDRVATEEVRIGAQIVPSNWTYDLSNGFLTQQTLTGFTHTFEIAPGGNVLKVKDGVNNETTFAYSWGVVSDVWKPHTHITYGVNQDGSVGATDNHVEIPLGQDYDAGGRITRVHRGTVTPIWYTYNNTTGRSYTVSRGDPDDATQKTTFTLDGFGRVISTVSLANVRTRTERDACGRTRFEALPYTTETQGQQGTAFTYDALGRVKTVTAPGNRVTTYTYDGSAVLVIDPDDPNPRNRHTDKVKVSESVVS